jgi:predicted dehydrogenase
MNHVQPLSRRQFLRRSTVAAASLTLPYLIPAGTLAAPGQPGANDRIGLAVIGTGRRAAQLFSDFRSLPGGANAYRLVACSDIWPQKAEDYVQQFEREVLKASAGRVDIFPDYRKLLERSDVDGVIIATTEHFRALPCVHACQAGKDVYAEKPLCLTIREGRTIVNAVRKYKRVFQTGTQQRSTQRNRQAVELVRNGRIGKLQTVVCQNWASSRPYRDFTIPAEPIPAGLDWDRWCGQTEPVPFSMHIYRTYNDPGWHNIATYSGGWLCNSGSHALDCVQWALGTDDTGPVEIWAEHKSWNAKLTYRYANGVLLKLEHSGAPAGKKIPGDPTPPEERASVFGAVFHGDRGTLYMHRGRFNTKPIAISQEPLRDDELHLETSNHHLHNWLQCIKSRNRPVAHEEIGHRSCTVCHLGNIARATGRKLTWDPVQEIFPGDAEANAFLERPQRRGYELPKIV